MSAFAWMAQQTIDRPLTKSSGATVIHSQTSMAQKTADNLLQLLADDGPWMFGDARRLLGVTAADLQCVLRLGEGRGLLRRERHYKGQWVWHKC